MQSMKKVGRVGGKALIYFEVVSTLALLIGMLVGNWLAPGAPRSWGRLRSANASISKPHQSTASNP